MEYTYFQYMSDVETEKIPTCDFVKFAVKRTRDFLNRTDIEFREDKVKKAINFIAKLKHTTGVHNNKPFILLPYQQYIIMNIFGFYYTGTDKRVTKNVYLELGRKTGKALDVNELIPTPTGFKKLKDINVGDLVFGSDGKSTEVISTEDHTGLDCYKVIFEDKTEVIACGEHNWIIKDKNSQTEKILTTEQMYNTRLFLNRKDGKGKEYRYRVPMSKPVEYSEKELPMDPYTLGVWLGDGCKSKAMISGNINDMEMYERINKLYGNPHFLKDKRSNFGMSLSYYKEGGMKDDLIKTGVWNNKHIPEIYLYSSIQQRLELLQGLCDTDGCCDKRGCIEFVQKNNEIAAGFCHLLSSLGIKYVIRKEIPKINGIPKDEVNEIRFFTDKKLPCFTLKRKYNRLKDSLNKRMNYKTIIDIQKVDSIPTKCLYVNNSDHTFLFGKNHTVTHNSSLVAAIGLYCMIADGESGSEVDCLASSRDQAKILFDLSKNFIGTIDPKEKLVKRYRNQLKFDLTKSQMTCFAADSNKLDGLNAYVGIVDEYHSAPDSGVYDVIKSSQGMRKNPLMIVITTAGFNLEGPCYEMRRVNIEIMRGVKQDDSQFTLIYTLDEADDWTDEKNFIKSNPTLGQTVSIQFLRDQIQQAMNNPSMEVGIRTKNLNQWCQSSSVWIPDKYILNATDCVDLTKFNDCVCFLGVDLAAVGDMTAMAVMIPKDYKYYYKVFYYLPEYTINNSPNSDKYRYWHQKGYLTLTPGNVTDYDYITNDIIKLQEKYGLLIESIGYDSYNATQWAIDCTSKGLNLIPVSQSIGNFSRTTKEMERLLRMDNGSVIIDNNPITRWCFANVAIKEDLNENIKPTKVSANQKIDGVIAMLQAQQSYFNCPQYGYEI